MCSMQHDVCCKLPCIYLAQRIPGRFSWDAYRSMHMLWHFRTNTQSCFGLHTQMGMHVLASRGAHICMHTNMRMGRSIQSDIA